MLVLLDCAERSEAVAAGRTRLVGTDPEIIVREAARLLDDPLAYAAMTRPLSLFGNAQAAGGIVDLLAAAPCGRHRLSVTPDNARDTR